MKKHLDITLTGKVQGVGFRYEVKEAADRLDIHGYARNLRDGTVVVEAEADGKVLNEFIEWLRSSPGLSEVTETKFIESEIKGFREFQIY